MPPQRLPFITRSSHPYAARLPNKLNPEGDVGYAVVVPPFEGPQIKGSFEVKRYTEFRAALPDVNARVILDTHELLSALQEEVSEFKIAALLVKMIREYREEKSDFDTAGIKGQGRNSWRRICLMIGSLTTNKNFVEEIVRYGARPIPEMAADLCVLQGWPELQELVWLSSSDFKLVSMFSKSMDMATESSEFREMVLSK